MLTLSFANSWSWESAFGALPKHKVRHETIAAAMREASRVAAVVARQNRGDGRCQAIVFRGRETVIGLPIRF